MSHDTQPASLRSFLLGTASDQEAETFSHLVLTDDQALLEALADEDELFDEYARGEMGDAEAARFEAVALQHAEGRRRLSFARALADRADENTASTTATFRRRPPNDAPATTSSDGPPARPVPGRWHRFWDALWAPAARPAWVLACGLLLILNLRQSFLSEPDRKPAGERPAAPIRTSAEADDNAETQRLADEVEQLRQEKQTLEERLQSAETKLAEVADAAQRAAAEHAATAVDETVSFLLTAATRGSRVADFKVPQETKRVELEVDLSDAPRVDRVNARLLDETGFQVWGRKDVPTEGDDLPAVRLRVPADSLDAGAYTLRVEESPKEAVQVGDGESREIALFDFRIQRN